MKIEKEKIQSRINITRNTEFKIVGEVNLESKAEMPSDQKLKAYAFDVAGRLLGTGDLDPKGVFNIAVNIPAPKDIELFVGPSDDPQAIRKSSAYSQRFQATDWIGEGKKYSIKADIFLPFDIWWPWRPSWICVSGHVRKVSTKDGHTTICPIPYVKVEIFDVDRESCFWPFIIKKWPILIDRPLIRIPELIEEIPPKPDPWLRNVLELVSLNPQPEPPIPLNFVTLNPQPEPPIPWNMIRNTPGNNPVINSKINSQGLKISSSNEIRTVSQISSIRSNISMPEMTAIDPAVASRIDKLTLTSKIPPWSIFPKCFYSKALVAETSTDCKGYFSKCFKWWPFHFRKGRLRFDSRPDIIIKVTQVIDGVSTVIYMDPYTSTRWDVTNAHIDLYLDNEEIQCGSGYCDERPEGASVFFTRIGDDEVYKINQVNGLYAQPPLSNVAYGGNLLIYGQFGDSLSNGAPARYYRLSYSKDGINFTPVISSMGDTRVNKSTLFSENHSLGPKTVNGVPALYEVRDFANYYWYNPDWIGTWNSWLAEADTGKYILRLEVFDENGGKLTSAYVDYRDGTAVPPAVLPPMPDHCDLVITLDNKPPVVDLQIPAVLNECGVIPWSAVPPLNFNINVSQENGRLNSWRLQYTKGINPAVNVLDGGSSNTGAPSVISRTIDGAASPTGINMLAGITSTCAFALKLWAYAHVRDGRNFIYYVEQIKAIAIEKCKPCPPPKS